jgi:hypothetical protein
VRVDPTRDIAYQHDPPLDNTVERPVNSFVCRSAPLALLLEFHRQRGFPRLPFRVILVIGESLRGVVTVAIDGVVVFHLGLSAKVAEAWHI